MSLPPEQQMLFARFLHPQKLLPPLPGVTDTLTAQLFGIDAAAYRSVTEQLQAVVDAAAAELLADDATAAAIRRLASRPITVVGLGDSLTDDGLGWFEIVRSAARQLGANAWTLVNAGISGQSSAEILARMPQVAAARPDIVICFAGTNDARRFGGVARPQLPLDATVSALRSAYEFAATHCAAKWLWVTPVGIDERKVAESFLFQMAQTGFEVADVEAIAHAIGRFEEPVVNLYGRLAGPDSFLGESLDGVHPEPGGHVMIARAILAALDGLG